MYTTTPGVDQHIYKTPPLIFSTYSIKPEILRHDVIGDRLEGVSRGPEIHFEVEEYDFDNLVHRLIEFEHEYGLSSLEMFSQYIHGMVDLDEEWLDLFILYLGTREVRQFSCP